MTDNNIDALKYRFEGCKWDLEVIKGLTPEELKEILDEKDVELAKTKDKINQALKDIRNSTAKLYEPLGELEEYLNES